MGKIRARTEGEIAARKADILCAAAQQLMQNGYDAITLATLAAATSISRTSIYTYYEKKEDVLVELMIQEYRTLEKALAIRFAEKMSREDFCRELTDVLFAQPVLLKLLSLQLPVRDGQYSDAMVQRFVDATVPYAQTLRRVLAFQFPDAHEDARERFMIQLTMYVNTLYVADHLPVRLRQAMEESRYIGRIPDAKKICLEGLLLLSAAMAES